MFVSVDPQGLLSFPVAGKEEGLGLGPPRALQGVPRAGLTVPGTATAILW